MKKSFLRFQYSMVAAVFCLAALLNPAAVLAQTGTHNENALMNEESPVPGISFRFIETNGIRMRLATMGDSGPLVIMAHGWPESWYSWRHQIKAVADAGYRVVAPDMRGYGATDAPADVEDYNIRTVAADIVGIVDAYGEDKAILMGHDWGSIVAWNTVLLHPERFSALVAMSVPYSGRPAESPLASWQSAFGENFYYILYHQEPGVAEAEYDADPRGLLSRLYLSPDSPREAPQVTDRHRSAGGWIPRLGAAKGLPDWLTQDDLDYFVSQFEAAGFRGGVNYYRNFHRNWEITPQLADKKVTVPTLFIAGENDVVIGGASQGRLQGAMNRVVEDLRGVVVLPEAGHWIQQELPEETNAAVLEFLEGL
ncbi:alpha/beta hydrolase [Pseudohongiella acticola]|jgi:epoxide hydrolase A/B|uniref:alpha/beta fold hydrolase n=1 Tax=Pseudohongiella acticola TaxID=1524254 RepID=UPI0030EEE5A8